MLRRHFQFWISCVSLVAFVGCADLDLQWPGTKRAIQKADAQHPVVECLCLWEPAEGRGLDNLPTRGCAGQILFSSAGRSEFVKVDGDVRIYLFDNQGTPEEQGKPIHQFDFEGPAWETYFREAKIGASYHVFIPYTRRGSQQADLTLRVRYTPKRGAAIYSKMGTIVLAGTKSEKNSADDRATHPITNLSKPVAVPEPKPMVSQIQTAGYQTSTIPNLAAKSIAPTPAVQPAATPDVNAVDPTVETPQERLQRLEMMLQQLSNGSRNSPSPTTSMPARSPLADAPLNLLPGEQSTEPAPRRYPSLAAPMDQRTDAALPAKQPVSQPDSNRTHGINGKSARHPLAGLDD